MEYTETFQVYRPRFVVQDDTNIVPAAVDLVGPLTGNMQRGSRSAQDQLTLLGIVDRKGSVAYFPPGSETSLDDRYVLKDQSGEIWLVRSGPILRDRFAATAHVWIFCMNLLFPPEGIE